MQRICHLTMRNQDTEKAELPPVVVAPTGLELVENAVVLVEGAHLAPQVVVNLVGLDRPALLPQVPHFDGQVVSGDDLLPVAAELDVGYARYYLREEAGVFFGDVLVH